MPPPANVQDSRNRGWDCCVLGEAHLLFRGPHQTVSLRGCATSQSHQQLGKGQYLGENEWKMPPAWGKGAIVKRVVRVDLTEKVGCEHRPKEKRAHVAGWGRELQAQGTASAKAPRQRAAWLGPC